MSMSHRESDVYDKMLYGGPLESSTFNHALCWTRRSIAVTHVFASGGLVK